MSTPPMLAPPRPAPSPSAYWQGWREVRQDLRAGLGLLVGLALAGVPAGVLWWWLAPRADYRITADGPVPVGLPTGELQVGDDVVLVFVLLGLGLIGGGAAWLRRRGRGVGTLGVLSLGASLAAVAAWQVGELLGPPPPESALSDVGSTVTTGLSLGALPVLTAAPFAALLTFLACVALTADDGLGREPASSGAPARTAEELPALAPSTLGAGPATGSAR